MPEGGREAIGAHVRRSRHGSGVSLTRSRKKGTPVRIATREPRAMSSPWSSCGGRPPAPPRPGLDASAGQVHFRHDRRRGALTARLHHRRDGDPGDRFFGLAAATLTAGLRLISWGPEDALPTGNPQEVAMSPLLLIVFTPLFIGGVAQSRVIQARISALARRRSSSIEPLCPALVDRPGSDVGPGAFALSASPGSADRRV